ncbi:unnamed protein product [Staurois parvus]|uniref:Uncharacterized protein n=1 Tax=Staurois parvus TaxID=386267 RepID=A0ABN9HHK5_9NEOB|nr:unnamed protein product [Staurois parvus]
MRWSLERRSRAEPRRSSGCRGGERPESCEERQLTADRGGSERAQAGAGVSKVSIIGVSGRNSAPSLDSLIPTMGHDSSPH